MRIFKGSLSALLVANFGFAGFGEYKYRVYDRSYGNGPYGKPDRTLGFTSALPCHIIKTVNDQFISE